MQKLIQKDKDICTSLGFPLISQCRVGQRGVGRSHTSLMVTLLLSSFSPCSLSQGQTFSHFWIQPLWEFWLWETSRAPVGGHRSHGVCGVRNTRSEPHPAHGQPRHWGYGTQVFLHGLRGGWVGRRSRPLSLPTLSLAKLYCLTWLSPAAFVSL